MAALRSTFAQAYTPIEVLVVDDGPTDGTAAIMAEFPPIRAARHAKN